MSAVTKLVIDGETVLITDRDDSTLRWAESLRRRFQSGIFWTGSGGMAHFAKLERMGLLEFVGYGRDIDGEIDRDVPVYNLTPKADKVLAVLGEG